MTYFSTEARSLPLASARPGFLNRLHRMLSVWRQRDQLRRLDSRALEDIGLTRADAEAEAARPIWDVPDTWRA